MKLKSITMLVSGRRNYSNEPVILPVHVCLTSEEFKQGVHYDIATNWATKNAIECISTAVKPDYFVVANASELPIVVSLVADNLQSAAQ